MASISEQCIRTLSLDLTEVFNIIKNQCDGKCKGQDNVEINLNGILSTVCKTNNRKSIYGLPNTYIKEIKFLNSLSKLQDVKVTTVGSFKKKSNSFVYKYPTISFTSCNGIVTFLKEMQNCPTILNSIFCYAGSAKIYKEIIKNLKG